MIGYGCHVGTEVGWVDGSAAGIDCEGEPSSDPELGQGEDELCISELPPGADSETNFLNECVSLVLESADECYALAYWAAYYSECNACSDRQ